MLAIFDNSIFDCPTVACDCQNPRIMARIYVSSCTSPATWTFVLTNSVCIAHAYIDLVCMFDSVVSSTSLGVLVQVLPGTYKVLLLLCCYIMEFPFHCKVVKLQGRSFSITHNTWIGHTTVNKNLACLIERQMCSLSCMADNHWRSSGIRICPWIFYHVCVFVSKCTSMFWTRCTVYGSSVCNYLRMLF